MDIPGLSELKDLITKIASLTTNVGVLQAQMDRALIQIEKNKEEITELKADLRVARAELEKEAVMAATSTVIQAHHQILEKISSIDRQNNLENTRVADGGQSLAEN